MNRRSHKKSRNGCGQCKSRHIKCDETRPICHHCRMAERKCDFEDPTAIITPAARRLSNVTSNKISSNTTADPIVSPLVDVDHMEALLHFSLEFTFPDYKFEMGEPAFKAVVMKYALMKPWLMHEVLAFSLRHLYWLDPSRTSLLRPKVNLLQSRAIQLFQQGNPHFIKENMTANFLFSSILGRHHLADTLATTQKDFDEFLAAYINCTRTLRGVRSIAQFDWPAIVDSDLNSFVQDGLRLMTHKPEGDDLADLTTAIRSSRNLSQDSISNCLDGLRFLQIGFDKLKDVGPAQRHQIAASWCVLCAGEIIDLIEQRVPEVMIMFGYYAVLLHAARDNWQIGDCAPFILQGIERSIGPEWAGLLSWPLAVVRLTEVGVQIQQ